MSPKIGTAKVGEKKSVRDEIAAFNTKPAVDPAAVAIAKRNAAAASKPKAEKPAKPVKPAPEPEPDEVEEEEEVDEDESSGTHPLVEALDANPPASRERGPWVKQKRAQVTGGISRLRYLASILRLNADAVDGTAKKVEHDAAQLDQMADALADIMRAALAPVSEKYVGVEPPRRAERANGKPRVVEGSHVRIVDKARKRFALVAKTDEMDKCEVLAVAGNNLAVKFKRGGQSLVRRVDVELVVD